jgi:hypothetical protein
MCFAVWEETVARERMRGRECQREKGQREREFSKKESANKKKEGKKTLSLSLLSTTTLCRRLERVFFSFLSSFSFF